MNYCSIHQSMLSNLSGIEVRSTDCLAVACTFLCMKLYWLWSYRLFGSCLHLPVHEVVWQLLAPSCPWSFVDVSLVDMLKSRISWIWTWMFMTFWLKKTCNNRQNNICIISQLLNLDLYVCLIIQKMFKNIKKLKRDQNICNTWLLDGNKCLVF